MSKKLIYILLIIDLGISMNSQAMTFTSEASPEVMSGTVELNTPFQINILINNNDIARTGHSMTYVFYSPDLSISDIQYVNVNAYASTGSVELLNGFEPNTGFFDLFNRITEFSWDGQLPDTINHSAMAYDDCAAWPTGLGEQEYILMRLGASVGDALWHRVRLAPDDVLAQIPAVRLQG